MCRTRCAGPTWHSAVPVADHWPLWEDLPRRYAAAQLALAAHRAELLATGTAERSPATLPNPAADPVDDPARRPPLQQHLRGPVRSGPPDRPGGGVANHRLGRPTIGHPFGTMTATLRSIAHHSGCEVDDPRVQRGARCLPRAVHDVRTTFGAGRSARHRWCHPREVAEIAQERRPDEPSVRPHGSLSSRRRRLTVAWFRGWSITDA